MRRAIAPTVSMDVRRPQEAEPGAYLDGYQTNRRRYDARIKRIFKQPLEKYMRSTNGGFASTQHRRTSTGTDSNPICLPGRGGRTNLAGWADVNSTEGGDTRPPFLRGSPFAQSHQQF